MKVSNKCSHCFVTTEDTIPDDTQHFFLSCVRGNDHRAELLISLDNIYADASYKWDWEDLLSTKHWICHQIKIANAMTKHVQCVAKLGFC